MTDILNAFVLLCNYIILPSLTYGSQLALGALGITLIYGVLRFSNLGHGETMSFGTTITILITWLFQSINFSVYPMPTALIALPFSIAVTVTIVLLTDRLIYRHYRKEKADSLVFMIASIGVMFILNGIIRFIIGPSDRRFDDGERFLMTAREFKAWSGLDEGLAIKSTQCITIITAVASMIIFFLFLKKTRLGKSMRAFADNDELSLLSGINPSQVVRLTWVFSATLAVVAGTLYGLDKGFKPFVFLQLLLPLFSAAILGGLGSPIGAVVGAFIIAFSEIAVTFAYKKFLFYLMPRDWEIDGMFQFLPTDYKFAVSFMILVLVLLVRPTGIFSGTKSE